MTNLGLSDLHLTNLLEILTAKESCVSFNNHDISMQTEGNVLWFKATDVEKALGLTNIRTSIHHFKEKEKSLRTIQTIKGEQKALFLSSQGLFRILYSSTNELAGQFREIVSEIISDILFNNGATLKENLQNFEMRMLQNNIDKIFKNNQHSLIDTFHKKGVVYMGFADPYTIKFGCTDDIKERMKAHTKDFGENFVLGYVVECDRNRILEKFVKQHPEIAKRRVSKIVNGKNQTELVSVDTLFTIEDFHKLTMELRNSVHNISMNKDSARLEMELELEKLRLTRYKLTNAAIAAGALTHEDVQSDDEDFDELFSPTHTVDIPLAQPTTIDIPLAQPTTIDITLAQPTTTNSHQFATIPPIPKFMENMHEFYTQWACEMRDKYNAHAQQNRGLFKWSKLFPKKEAVVMKKRYNRLKHFLNYLDNSTNPSDILQQLEQFAIDNKITHNRLVKDVFYQCMRSETVNAADDIKDAVKNLQTLLDKITEPIVI